MKIKKIINGLNAQRYESDSQIWRNTISAILYPDTATAMSWGVSLTGECRTAVDYYGQDEELIAVKLVVNGLLHKGDIYVAYDMGADMYRVSFDGKELSDELYFDQLQAYIDARTERRPEWTDKEYINRIKEEERRKQYA